MALCIGQDRNTIFETQVQLQTPGKKLPTKREAEMDAEHQVYLQSKHTKKKWVRSHHKFKTHKHKKGG